MAKNDLTAERRFEKVVSWRVAKVAPRNGATSFLGALALGLFRVCRSLVSIRPPYGLLGFFSVIKGLYSLGLVTF